MNQMASSLIPFQLKSRTSERLVKCTLTIAIENCFRQFSNCSQRRNYTVDMCIYKKLKWVLLLNLWLIVYIQKPDVSGNKIRDSKKISSWMNTI